MKLDQFEAVDMYDKMVSSTRIETSKKTIENQYIEYMKRVEQNNIDPKEI
jgi:hypothetical protein